MVGKASGQNPVHYPGLAPLGVARQRLPGRAWENGYNESFNGKLRDECLNMEIFYTLREAKVLIEQWRRFYNTQRPHSSLGYRPPAPQAILPPAARLAYVMGRASLPLAQNHARP